MTEGQMQQGNMYRLGRESLAAPTGSACQPVGEYAEVETVF
jgi:hypothetical protein